MSTEKLNRLVQGDVRQVIEQVIDYIASENKELHAVSNLFATEALMRAEQLDKKKRLGEPLGPLHGVPILFKELVDIAGVPTNFGSQCYSTSPAVRNAPLIDRLQTAGAVILGTTNMVEFAVGSWGTNYVQGTPKNPADRDHHRIAGGSSSGSAVAVAADFVPIAFGSDTGGSIRIPASLCGIVGYKPSYGLIPMQGVAPTGPSFDTLGPMTRNVADARLATEVATGLSLAHPDFTLEGVKIAHVSTAALEPIDTLSLAAYKDAYKMLEAHGAELVEIVLPIPLTEIQKLNGDIVSFEAYRHLHSLVDDPSKVLDGYVRERVKAGEKISEAAYRDSIEHLNLLRIKFEEVFAKAEFLFLPGTPMPAPIIDDVDESQIPMSRYTRICNCLNLCAIALPMPTTTHSLPVGIQLAARNGCDAKLLALAEVVEKLNGKTKSASPDITV